LAESQRGGIKYFGLFRDIGKGLASGRTASTASNCLDGVTLSLYPQTFILEAPDIAADRSARATNDTESSLRIVDV
jgi:hypothetical protein